MKQIPQLDGIRCIAIVCVIFAHWIAWDINHEYISNFPWVHGVLLFFVLSGYLITNILLDLREKMSESLLSLKKALSTFYIRRFLRIFPIYYITIFYLFWINFDNTRELFPWLVSYTSNFFQSTGKPVGAFTPFWSLAIEEQFYLIWPFLILLLPSKFLLKGIYWAAVISFLSKLVFLYLYPNEWMLRAFFSLNSFLPLALGALVAYYKRYNEKIFLSFFCNKALFYVTGIVYISLLYYFKKSERPYGFDDMEEVMCAFWGMLFIALASASKFTYMAKWMLENRISRYIGRISYGLYVYHMFMSALFFSVVASWLTFQTFTKHWLWFDYAVLLLVVASLSYYLVERPLNSLKKKFPY
jgi:peptidoglycan/LPS O-acetylase OafA/YrhL